MSVPQFYCVLGNRDYLKVTRSDGVVKEPIWRYIIDHNHYLTSLVYLHKEMQRPGARFLLDCGAWSYKNAPEPKWTPQQCVEKYATFARAGDMAASPDHLVLRNASADEETRRVEVTLTNAREFLALCPPEWRPIGVTHGNTLEIRMRMLRELLEMGYRHIAIGSVAIRAGSQRSFVRAILEDAAELRREQPFYLHVLGISALSWYPEFAALGVDSYDGSSMFLRAFTAGEYDWHRGDGTLASYSVKRDSTDAIPLCHCPPCLAMRREGYDTRQMGSNENNMGRAVHNINQYLAALTASESQIVTRDIAQQQSLFATTGCGI